ncbi:M16 family metallopeptidase [Thermanaerovibrio acidaminovorans]|uniref:Processing peptidase n=1 Tax=Thermanaerovibrio acidaminovorans (strain ATCC 49978 / DSM 6589 / Su883) TaxID=525903 RepID=D1B8X9_THEAS|nr:M16 family metallopeptidase [Thermanaerovibrio acidaminovorans]ACZ18732.1 processing peptidase [Thermanaerovibrio acidaminovorans DSM 6589]
MKHAIPLLVMGFLLVSWAPAFGAARVKAEPSIGGVTEYQLGNGLKVLLIRDPGASNVTVNVVYRVGSSDERDGQRGLAHLLEHLLFKGTPSHPDIPSEIAARGGRANGTTWTDRTCYFQTLPATMENLRWALSLESERMTSARITAEELERERGVVINELVRGENDPVSVLLNRLSSVAFDWHTYGNSTIGNRRDLETVSLDEVLGFYRSFVRPDNGVLVIASPFEDREVLGEVEARFGSIPRPSHPVPRRVSQELGKDGDRFVRLRQPGQFRAVGALYHGPAGSSPEAAAFQVLMEVMGLEPSGGLYRELVMKGLAGAVWAGSFLFRDSSMGLVLAQLPMDGNPDRAAEVMLSVLEDPSRIDQRDVEQAKQRLMKKMDLKYANPDDLAVELTEWISRGDWRLFFAHRRRLEMVSVEDVRRVASRYLVRDNRTWGIFEPSDRRVLISTDGPRDVEPGELSALGGLQEQGEAVGPSPEALEARTSRFRVSGLKGAVINKRTRGGWVYGRLGLNFGNLSDLEGRSVIGEVLSRYLGRGAGDLSREEVQREFDRLRASVSFSGSATGVTVDLKVPVENLEGVLALVARCLREPRFDEGELRVLKLEMRSEIEDQLDDPSVLAEEELDRAFNPYPVGDVRRPVPMAERLRAIDSVRLRDLRDFHRRFFGLVDGELAVVGPVEEGALMGMMSSLFGGWVPRATYERVPYPFVAVEGGRRRVEVPGKPNATVAAWAPLRLTQDSPDYPALLVAVNVLGGGWLDSRLARRIRHQDGTSYGVRLSLNAFDPDESARLEFWAIAAPGDVERVRESFYDEVRRALEGGFTAEEVSRAKAFILEGVKVDRSQDGKLVRRMERDLYLGRDFGWHRRMEEAVGAVTSDSALEALRRHLRGPEAFLLVEVGSFEGRP